MRQIHLEPVGGAEIDSDGNLRHYPVVVYSGVGQSRKRYFVVQNAILHTKICSSCNPLIDWVVDALPALPFYRIFYVFAQLVEELVQRVETFAYFVIYCFDSEATIGVDVGYIGFFVPMYESYVMAAEMVRFFIGRKVAPRSMAPPSPWGVI